MERYFLKGITLSAIALRGIALRCITLIGIALRGMALKGIALCLLIFLVPITHSKIFTCTNADGVTIYTDKEQDCGDNAEKVSYETIKDIRQNFRYPKRRYVKQVSKYNIYAEAPESDFDQSQFALATKKLTESLTKIYQTVPAPSANYLKKIDFYIMIGPRAKNGGETRIYRYYPKNSEDVNALNDKRWSNSIVIFDVDRFVKLDEYIRTKIMMHELAHGWQENNYRRHIKQIKDAWLTSRQQSLYLAQKDLWGRILKPAYATTSESEYFAELSAAYFIGGTYYPFNRAELQRYDPVGYNMVERVWGIK